MEGLNLKTIISSIVLLSLGVAAGFFLGRFSLSTQVATNQAVKQTVQAPKVENVFKSETATFQGVVTKAGEKLTLKNDKGQVADFLISPKAVIYKPTGQKGQASASADIKSVELNKKVLIILELKDNNYQIISVSYL